MPDPWTRPKLNCPCRFVCAVGRQVAQERRHKLWTSLEAQLQVLSHRRTLERGFALVHGANGLVRDLSQIKPDERLRLELAESDLTVRPEVD